MVGDLRPWAAVQGDVDMRTRHATGVGSKVVGFSSDQVAIEMKRVIKRNLAAGSTFLVPEMKQRQGKRWC